MTFFSFLPFAASIFSLVLAFMSLLAKKHSLANRCFCAGMVVLGIDSLVTGFSLRATDSFDIYRGQTLGLIVKSFLPAAWLGFSLTYSRGNFRESLGRWRVPLSILTLLPIGLALGFRPSLLEWEATGVEGDVIQLRLSALGKALNINLLIALVWILMNLEQTFRSAVGTMRWRIKFVILGLGVIFGAQLYVQSQVLLFSTYDANWSGIESSALLIGCAFLVVAYIRTGFVEIDVYPSRAILRSSLTVLIVGGYLFLVGVLARILRHFGGAESFQMQAFVVLLGVAGLAVMLFSDRLRQRAHGFLNRHFARAQHDSVRIWTEFSRRLGNVKDQAGLCTVSGRLISETLEVLSVTIWLMDEQKDHLEIGASTAPQLGEDSGDPSATASSAVVAGLLLRSSPFDLDAVDKPWAEELRQLNSTTFPNGGHRWCVPLGAGEQILGAMVLTDRVNGARYTVEELQLLQCIAAQVTSVLLNLRLASEVARAKEMEAFRTLSAFFVHDLKNTASSLNLMLQNLPVHFDDPAFREDAMRGIGNMARRIDEMLGRLTALRQRPSFTPVTADLNQLVNEAVAGLEGLPQVELRKELRPLPPVMVDREQIQSVVSNLILNARDAVGLRGLIELRTEHLGGSVMLTVADNGTGMSPAFVRDSLFRPFQSTKKKGLGIGMFQSRTIVEAHGGSIRVESQAGKGSTFRVSLPVEDLK